MNQAFSLLSIWVATALVALACSTGDGASTDGLNNPCGDACDEGQNPLDLLPPDTLISTLNKDELVAFCERRDTFHTTFLTLQTNPSLECTAEGLDLRFQEGADVQACEAARDACIETAMETPQPSFDMLDCLPFQVSSTEMRTCAVSLEAFDNCTAALLAQAEALVESLNCTITLEEAAVFQAQDNSSLPAACDIIESDCPPILAEFNANAD